MNPEGLKVLAERASSVEGRASTRLDEVHARIAQARRRRQVGSIGAAVVAVVLALTVGLTFVALTETDHTPPAVPAPRPSVTPHAPDEKPESVRLLTYANGHTIHWGDRAIDVGSRVWDVEPTDDGVVFVRDSRACPYGDKCRTLWFTEGSEPVRIGTVTGSWIRGFDIVFSNAGSTVVWSEPDPKDKTPYYPGRGDFVVYDTGAQTEVGRFGSPRSQIVAVLDDDVYWLPDEKQCVDFYGECLRFKGTAMRFEASTGRQVPVSWASYRAVRGSSARTLVTPQIEEIQEGKVVTPAHPAPKFSDRFGFRRDGTRLIGDDGTVDVTVRVASSGKPLKLRIPAGYGAADYFSITQWLDDDHVVLSAGDTGDLFVCRASSGRCRLVVTGPVLTSFAGRG